MCGLMNIDIPQLSSSGIEFGNHSFQFVDSIQSSSRFSNFSFSSMQLNLSRLFGGYNRKRSMFHHDSNVEYCTYIIIMFFFEHNSYYLSKSQEY